jgi:hypothetical protein
LRSTLLHAALHSTETSNFLLEHQQTWHLHQIMHYARLMLPRGLFCCQMGSQTGGSEAAELAADPSFCCPRVIEQPDAGHASVHVSSLFQPPSMVPARLHTKWLSELLLLW